MDAMLWMEAWPAALLGLFIGSFLNVVVHRLPKMLKAQWQAECQQLLYPDLPMSAQLRYNLVAPRSACPHCGHQIRWFENIPLMSYVFLRGRCSQCGVSIGWRYPAIELVTALLFGYCASRWGWSWQAAAWCVFCAALVALAFIDWDTTLLPDDITLPLMWLGLVAAALRWNMDVTLADAVWGVVAGYLSLWSVYWLFKLLTGKEGMGYGDFKLFAALGAWFGWQALIPIILLASVIGVIVGLALKLNSSLREGGYVPFGPFLAGAGFVSLVFGPASVLRAIGL